MIDWQTFKSQVPNKLHGPDLSKVSNLDEKAREAAGTMLLRIDPTMTKRKARIANAIYDQVYNYVAPVDLKGDNKIVDIRPLSQRSSGDSNRLTSPRSFDINKEDNTISVEVINGVKTLFIAKDQDPRTILHRCDSLTLGGTVTATGDIQNLTENELDKVAGKGSLQFDLSGNTGGGVLEFELDDEIDLSDMEDLGALFHFVKLPDASDFSSITLRWGEDDSNYWERSASSPLDRDSWEDNGWALNEYTWADANKTGSPSADSIDYIEIRFSYTNTQQNVFVDNITAALGKPYEIVYYSDRLFRDNSDTWHSTPQNETDKIMLDDSALNIFMYEFMKACAQSVQGKDMQVDMQYYNGHLEGSGDTPGLYDKYEENYPSEAMPEQENYYDFRDIGPLN